MKSDFYRIDKRLSLSQLKTLVFFLLLLIAFNVTDTLTATPADLKKINNEIGTLKTALTKDQRTRTTYVQNLRSTEIASVRSQNRLKKTNVALKKQLPILEQLNKNKIAYQTQLAAQQQKLAIQIRSAYQLGQAPYLKLLLNQNDAEMLSRLFMYYHYLNQTYVTTIQDLQNTLAALQRNQTAIEAETQVLQKIQRQQYKERQRLEKLASQRRQAISNLNNQIQTKQQRLAELLNNKRMLEKTLVQLERQNHFETTPNTAFPQLEGKLSWPTRGSVLPYFGTPIEHSELKWDGVLIKAPEDQPIYAVADGQVVFAKWLPGYGLLLIISHGHGYMTLYGRNHYLYKKPGDLVHKGDTIATVGQSGGYEEPALYFAIRHNAEPLNPSTWCARRH